VLLHDIIMMIIAKPIVCQQGAISIHIYVTIFMHQSSKTEHDLFLAGVDIPYRNTYSAIIGDFDK